MQSSKPELRNLRSGEVVCEETKKLFDTSRQYYAVLCMNLLAFSYGCTCGWLSGALIVFEDSKKSPLSDKLTDDEVGWIGSAIGLGGFVANLFFGWLSEKTGRKFALYVVVVPQLLSWIFIYYARTPFYLIVSRIFGGFAGGGVFTLIPLYTSEIADDRVRGVLGSFIVLCVNFGLLFAYICGGYFDYFTVPFIMIPFSAAFIILFTKYPDSPSSLIKRKLYDEAEKSYLFYRSIDKYSREASALFEENVMSLTDDSNGNNKISLRDFESKSSRKAFIYGIVLMALNQFCGCFALLTYSATIFQQSGSNFSPVNSSIMVATIQILGALCASILVEKVGRKVMMSISAFGAFGSLSCMGTYLLLLSMGFKFELLKFIPLLTFSLLIFLANLGIMTLPFMILNEISPPKIRGFTSVLCMAFLWIFVFCVIRYLPSLIDSLGLHSAVFLFAFNSLVGGIFILWCIPETRGRSFEQIMYILEQ